METRELAEKIVLAMLESGSLKLSEVNCFNDPPKEFVIQKMKERARIIKVLIDVITSELSSK